MGCTGCQIDHRCAGQRFPWNSVFGVRPLSGRASRSVAARAKRTKDGPLVSRKVSRTKARIDDLVDELTAGAAMRLRCDGTDIHGTVSAVVDYLVENYPAQDLYIPADIGPSAYPVEAIRDAVKQGKSMRSIQRTYRVSRRTIYRLMDESA